MSESQKRFHAQGKGGEAVVLQKGGHTQPNHQYSQLMVDFSSAYSTIRCTCPKGMAAALQQEVEAHGYVLAATDYTGVELSGTLQDCMYLNLQLRCCHKVLYRVQHFRARNPSELYKALVRVPWEEYLTLKANFTIDNVTQNENIKDTRFASLKAKDAIADRCQQVYRKRPDSRSDKDQAVVFLFCKESDAAVFLDTSGQPLSRHGYRKRRVEAPLSEALAAALVSTSGWQADRPFVNPMCGSGTLAIEAALQAINRPPGLLREQFGFMYLKGYQSELWHRVREQGRQQVALHKNLSIIATDHDAQAVKVTEDNARRAGVLKYLQVKQAELNQTPIPETPGTIIMNPPYGGRMGNSETLSAQYAGIGDFLKHQAKGYKAWVLTGNTALAKHIALRTESRYTFYNGKLACKLLGYTMY
jgi:putative N6-adenine-specific DNA methylase